MKLIEVWLPGIELIHFVDRDEVDMCTLEVYNFYEINKMESLEFMGDHSWCKQITPDIDFLVEICITNENSRYKLCSDASMKADRIRSGYEYM